MSAAQPLACNPYGIPSDQREAHSQLAARLFQTMRSMRELDDGITFEFAPEAETILRLAKFIVNERLCCPFLNFTLEAGGEPDPVKLTLSGPKGTKEFLLAELPLERKSS